MSISSESGSDGIVFAGIAPHPPIMVPEVGLDSVEEVRGSIDAMRNFTERITRSGAETVVMISPHAPLFAKSFVAYNEQELYGSFVNFGAPDATVRAPLDQEMLSAITREAAAEGYTVSPIEGYFLDHGTAVPVYFLLRYGWKGALVAIGYSFLSNDDHLSFGACIRRAAASLGRNVAIVASGDLSHRLKPTAPAGYFPGAQRFDDEVVDCIRAGEPRRIVDIDQDLRQAAGECGYRSMLVAIGATSGLELNCEMLHYEAPFGVGYMVAQLMDRGGVARGVT